MTTTGTPHGFAGDLFAPLGEWTKRAACKSSDPALFDVLGENESADDAVRRLRTATPLCADCPVRALCAAEAAENDHSGVWGGVWLRGYQGARPVDLVAKWGDTDFWWRFRRELRQNIARRVGGAA